MEFSAHSLSPPLTKRFQVADKIFLECESRPGMVNNDQVKCGRKSLNRRVAELIEGAFFPADADSGWVSS